MGKQIFVNDQNKEDIEQITRKSQEESKVARGLASISRGQGKRFWCTIKDRLQPTISHDTKKCGFSPSDDDEEEKGIKANFPDDTWWGF